MKLNCKRLWERAYHLIPQQREQTKAVHGAQVGLLRIWQRLTVGWHAHEVDAMQSRCSPQVVYIVLACTLHGVSVVS